MFSDSENEINIVASKRLSRDPVYLGTNLWPSSRTQATPAMVIKIGKLISPPIRDIFILVLIDYNTLHLTLALERERERADDSS